MGHYRKNLITLFLNDYCNMRCIYCPLHAKRNAFYSLEKKTLHKDSPSQPMIDLDFAKCGVRDFFEQTRSYQIRLFSNGEATLAFTRMCEITDYAYSLAGKDLYVELQSNGNFKQAVCDWINENVHMLWLSLDGVADIQNSQRPGVEGKPTFEVIDRNIKALQQAQRTRIGLRATISDDNIKRQTELIDYAKENGIEIIYAYPWVSYLGRKPGMPDLMEFADSYIEARAYAERIGVYYGTIFMINFDEEVEINCRALLPAPHLTPDGYVTSCDMQNSGDGLMNDLVYGKWDSEAKKIVYYPEKLEKIRSRNIHNLGECQGCPALKHCAGGCVGAGIISTGLVDFYGINEEYCEVTKYLFERLPQLVNVGYNPKLPLHP